MIRVALLIPTLERSGAEKQLVLLATRLPRHEFDVRVVCLTRGGPFELELRAAGIPVTVLGKRLRFDPTTWWRLGRWLRKNQTDILHTWLFAANAYGRLVAGGAAGPKVIVSERCVDLWKSGWQKWLDRRLAGRMARLVANSQSTADFYAGIGIPTELITIIPNGVPAADDPPDRDAILDEFGIPRGARLVGYVGRLAKQKRVHDLVWGFQLLRQVMENVYFLIVGDGPERNGLVRLAKHMGCDHLTRFAGHRADAERLMGAMNVVWLGSDFEGMSNSLMEAMAGGIPVVATDIPPNRELVVDGETGFLVRVGDSVGFCQFTDRILADPELAARLGAASRQRALESFSVERMVEEHVGLYRNVAGNR